MSIECYPNELPNELEKSRKGSHIFDLIVKATFKSKKSVYIDIEVQTSIEINYLKGG